MRRCGAVATLVAGLGAFVAVSLPCSPADATEALAGGYERFEPRRAADVLPPKLRKGAHHQVRDPVRAWRYQHQYVVDSDFGEFRAEGDAMLRRLVREIDALAAMREVTKTKAFAEASKAALASPFEALRDLAVHPVDTVTGVPRGLGRLFQSAGQTIEGQESDYEDDEAKAILTVSKFKRAYAARLGIDVYTSNVRVQEELNRIGWTAAIGNLAPSVLTAPVGGPAKIVTSSLSWVDTLNDVLEEQPPSALRARNEKALRGIGVEEALIRRFLDHPLYSPRHETVLVSALSALDGAAGRDQVLVAALGAESETEALFFQQLAETLAGYHRSTAPIVELVPYRDVPVALAKNGALLVAFPLDYGRWTQASAAFLLGLARPPVSPPVSRIDLWVTGTVSPRLRAQLPTLGISLGENVDEKLELMD